MAVFNKESSIGTQNNFATADKFARDKDVRRTILCSPDSVIESYLDRTQNIQRIRDYFSGGDKLVVIHGEDGHGKTTLAKLFYQAAKADYEQIGWIGFNTDLRLSVVNAFDSFRQISPGKKGHETYHRLADRELNELKNYAVRRLLIIDNVTNWQEVMKFVAFLQLEQTDYLITSPEALDPKFVQGLSLNAVNYPVPIISGGEKQLLIRNFLSEMMEGKLAEELGNNLFLYNLIVRQVPTSNPDALRAYLTKVVSEARNSGEVLIKIIAESNLTGPEIWLLLQFAAMPDGEYTPERLGDLLFYLDHRNSPTDITDLTGYDAFCLSYPEFVIGNKVDLEEILQSLAGNGWLDRADDDYYGMHVSLGGTLREYFQSISEEKQPLPVEIFTELLKILRGSFFVESKDASVSLRDNLLYEHHLEALIGFVPPQSDELYLDLLWKAIGLKKSAGRFHEELDYRQLHWSVITEAEVENQLRAQAGLELQFCLQACGKYVESIDFGKGLMDSSLGILSQAGYAASVIYISYALQELGRYNEALKHANRALKIELNSLDPHHPQITTSYSNIGTSYNSIGGILGSMGLYDEALENTNKALEIQLNSLDPQHPDIATSYSNIGGILQDMGRYGEALENANKALEIQLDSLDQQHPYIAMSKRNIARIEIERGNLAGLENMLKEAMASLEKSLPENHVSILLTEGVLGYYYAAAGNPSAAKPLLTKALRTLEHRNIHQLGYQKTFRKALEGLG